MNPHRSTEKPDTEKSIPGFAQSRNWLAGSAIATGAMAATNASAGIVQITQDSSLRIPFSSLPANGVKFSIESDLTGDGLDDAPGLNVSKGSGASATMNTYFKSMAFNLASTLYASVVMVANTNGSGAPIAKKFYVSVNGTGFDTQSQPFSKSFLVGVTFRDNRINSGAPTDGLIHVRATSTASEPVMEIVRLIFDDESTILIGATATDSYPEWESPADRAARLALIASLESKAKKLKKKAALAKRAGQTAKAKRLLKKAKSFLARARSLKR